LDDVELFAEMDRENRARKDLRPYEQGRTYVRALDNGLFPSARKMAEVLGIDHSNMSKVLTLARLPGVVIAAFPSPLDIQVHWGRALAQALQKDPDIVLSRAKEMQAATPKPSAKVVFDALISGRGTVPHPANSGRKRVSKFKGAGGQIGTFAVDGAKRHAAWIFSEISERTAGRIHDAIVSVLINDAIPKVGDGVLAPGARVKILHGTVKGREGKVMRDHGDGTYLVKCRGNTPAAIYYPAQLQVLGAA
jgi:ParB family chromosome partitioning protein